MAATTLSAPTHSAEALLNRARRLSSASYEKNHPQPPSPTRFPDGEEPERLSPGLIANSNSSHSFLSSSLSRPLSGSRRRSSFGRTHLPPSFYLHTNRSDTSADSERFLDPQRARSLGCATTTSLALSLSSNTSSTPSTPAPSSPSLSPTTSASSTSSSPTAATADGFPITSTTAPITTRRSWSVSSRPRALTLESIKETDLLSVEQPDDTLAMLQARKDVHRKHRSENGHALGFVSDILQVLRQGSDVDLTQTIGQGVDSDSQHREEQEEERREGGGATAKSFADNSTSKGETTKKDDAGSSSSSSSLVSLTVTLAPCIDTDADDTNNTQQTPSIHIIDNENGEGDGAESADAHSQPIQTKNRDQETADIVMQTLNKAEAEQSSEKAGSVSSKHLPALPEDAKKHDSNAVDATISATTPTKTPALNPINGVQNPRPVPDDALLSAISPSDDLHHDQEDDDEQDDAVSPLTAAPPSSSSQAVKSLDVATAGASSGKSGKLNKKRSSKLFGKLVPKFLQTSFIPMGAPGQGVVLTPSPHSASSTVSTPSSGKSLDSGKTLLLPPVPSISPTIERDVNTALQHTTEQGGGEPKDTEQRSLLDFGRKTSRRSSQSSVQSRASSTTVPASSPLTAAPMSTSTPPSSVSMTATPVSSSSTIAVTFSEEDAVTSAASTVDCTTQDEDNNNHGDETDKADEEDASQTKKAKNSDDDDTEFWSSILRKSSAATEAAAMDTPEALASLTVTTSSLASRLASYPSSTSLSSTHSLSSPVCYATESSLSTDPYRTESDTNNSYGDESGLRHPRFKPDDHLSCVSRDERRLRLRDAVAEWRRTASSTH
ncbi:hypothetical protein BGZ73_007718 [Actinomortierella ambigua]|nr:hypothetical protein BGZ73_007718 [Actinomortierella ambigua]